MNISDVCIGSWNCMLFLITVIVKLHLWSVFKLWPRDISVLFSWYRCDDLPMLLKWPYYSFTVNNNDNKNPLIYYKLQKCILLFCGYVSSYSLQPFEHPYCTDKGVIFDIVCVFLSIYTGHSSVLLISGLAKALCTLQMYVAVDLKTNCKPSIFWFIISKSVHKWI